jgi:energy-coupling factor transporter ATP-binding protein EcfA2
VKLADVWIHGLRRFGGDSPHRVRIDAKLVCLIGANEAGKSTVLHALELAHQGEPTPTIDRTRREHVPDDRVIVRLRYRLDAADKDALAHIPCQGDPTSVHWFNLSRTAGGGLSSSIEPTLVRDLGPRRALHGALEQRSAEWWPEDAEEEEPGEPVPFAPDEPRVQRLLEAVQSDARSLVPETIADLRELANEVEGTDAALSESLRNLAIDEEHQPPDRVAAEILWERRPVFVRFDDEARLLESEHDLTQASTGPGTALGNLVRLARLPVDQLVAAVNAGETGTVVDLITAANETLAARFAAWQQQPPVRVVLDTDGTLLRVHVQSGEGATMQLRERSDGLRQFVALVALTAQHHYTVPPVLLIDEAETHLHYNAQADLIDVLTTQTAAAQVIYTTHSAACLPQDLGLGVRVVEGVGEQMASTVRQNFWHHDNPGIGALLMAMGASSLVYVALRPAAIAEGGSDLVLLPTLFREAIGSESIGFAVVPGSSSAPPQRIAGLDLQGVRTVWLLDADPAGRLRRQQLVEANIPEERICLLVDDNDLEIEDLIDETTYAEAVVLYARDVGSEETFSVADLPNGPSRRHETVEAWFESRGFPKPGKIAIANKIIELAGDRPLLADAHADAVRALHVRARELIDRH